MVQLYEMQMEIQIVLFQLYGIWILYVKPNFLIFHVTLARGVTVIARYAEQTKFLFHCKNKKKGSHNCNRIHFIGGIVYPLVPCLNY